MNVPNPQLSMNARSFRRILPYAGNSTPRKITLVALLGVWIAIELGITFLNASPPVSVEWIRYLVLWIIAREHGIELAAMGGGPAGYNAAQQTDDKTNTNEGGN